MSSLLKYLRLTLEDLKIVAEAKVLKTMKVCLKMSF